ncbi:hypothetical protein DCAR_0104979 [Daucus carota subsp. sativus]|uniref:Uncharacterized protein n=1 Tax=Daucus carota subsp. sativus TaxID=79200 RepID=A0A166J9S9_DAUCS|nr:hypothetical protein DCAR_0104979 [Daucus carota subsp. sativus]
MDRLLLCLKAAEPGVDAMGGVPVMEGVGAVGPIAGAIGAGGELIDSGLMAGGVTVLGGLAIGDGASIVGGGMVGVGNITRGSGAMVVEGDMAGA